MSDRTYEVFETGGRPVKAWVKGVAVEDAAREQLRSIGQLPFIFKWIAAMPDVHLGMGATVGSVIATKRAIIPAAVGVDLGCGMMAVRTTLRAVDLPDSLANIRSSIERSVPHGRTNDGRPGDRGAWGDLPEAPTTAWGALAPRFEAICAKHPKVRRGVTAEHLGTLGTGNHFIELCLDHAALGLAWRGEPHRHLLHQPRQGGNGALAHLLAKQGSGLPAPGHLAV